MKYSSLSLPCRPWSCRPSFFLPSSYWGRRSTTSSKRRSVPAVSEVSSPKLAFSLQGFVNFLLSCERSISRRCCLVRSRRLNFKHDLWKNGKCNFHLMRLRTFLFQKYWNFVWDPPRWPQRISFFSMQESNILDAQKMNRACFAEILMSEIFESVAAKKT